MNPVDTPEDILRETKRIINSLYGDDVSDLTIGETFKILKDRRYTERFDVQVRFMQNNLKHTVDLEIEKDTCRVLKAIHMDTMKPL